MAYEILSQKPLNGSTLYTIVLKADDGYQETQQYVGDVKTLEAADKHFNSERLAYVASLPSVTGIDTTPTDNVGAV